MSEITKNAPWKEPFEVRSRAIHVDPRGSLFEILRFADDDIPGGGQLYMFSIEPGKRRGDHYHLRKREWFICVSGEALLLLESEKGEKERVTMSAKDPKIIYSAPGTSHALINNQKVTAVIISYGSKQHDPDDPDTFQRWAGD